MTRLFRKTGSSPSRPYHSGCEASTVVRKMAPLMSCSAATFAAPYFEFLEGMIAAGLLPCAGEIDLPTHASYSLVPLWRSRAFAS